MLNADLDFSCNHLKHKFVASREFEQQRELRERGLQSVVDSHGNSAPGRIPYSEEATSDQTDKVLLFTCFSIHLNTPTPEQGLIIY